MKTFDEQVNRSATGCWLWDDRKGAGGYGILRWKGKVWRSHRLAWTLASGPIPEGMLVCHTCDTRNCVRPDHLFLGTAKDNTRDMMQKGRASWQRKE